MWQSAIDQFNSPHTILWYLKFVNLAIGISLGVVGTILFIQLRRRVAFLEKTRAIATTVIRESMTASPLSVESVRKLIAESNQRMLDDMARRGIPPR